MTLLYFATISELLTTTNFTFSLILSFYPFPNNININIINSDHRNNFRL